MDSLFKITYRVQHLGEVEKQSYVTFDAAQKTEPFLERCHDALLALLAGNLERFVQQRDGSGPLQLIATVGRQQELHPVPVAQGEVTLLVLVPEWHFYFRMVGSSISNSSG